MTSTNAVQQPRRTEGGPVLKGFKEFIMRGNIVDLAVAVVIGTAFVALVTAFTEAFINPLLAAAGGGDVAEGLGFNIRGDSAATFVDIGAFLTACVTFLITAAVVYFFVVVPMKKIQEMRARGQEPEPEAVPEDVLVLKEIRDLLAGRGPRPSDTGGNGAATAASPTTPPAT